jgi:hypothetical protein
MSKQKHLLKLKKKKKKRLDLSPSEGVSEEKIEESDDSTENGAA